MTAVDISSKCSQHFYYADFIQCGETQTHTQIINTPQDPRTIQAIEEIALTILDPVVKQFGSLSLSYGFCSNNLLKHIKKKPSPGISPQLDQHAGYELNSKNNRFASVMALPVIFMCLALTH